MTQDVYTSKTSVHQCTQEGTVTKTGTRRTPATASREGNPVALLPFGLFLLIFVGAGIYLTTQGVEYAFYKYPAPVCVLPAVILSVFFGRKQLNETIEEFIRGVGDSNIISMCMIFLLAGAFATVAKATGGVDATVSLGLRVIPSYLLTPGFFLISAFIATAMGTSMGTNAAVAPIALGVAEAAGIPVTIMAGAVMSGSMFGDNLSIISDTTIAATRTQGCEMKDKFRENVYIALPAAVLCFAVYTFFTGNGSVPVEGLVEWLKVVPYLTILLLAVSGFNVFLVLVTGIILAGLVGLTGSADYHLSSLASDIYSGFQSNQEIFLLSMLIGGLGRLMEKQGGLAFITGTVGRLIGKLQKICVSNRKNSVAEAGIAALVSLINICTANNTVAIVVAGKAAREIAETNGLTARRSASILDIYSCVIQGLIPYGAQALLLGTLFSLSPVDIVTNSFYPMLLAVSGLFFTIFRASKARV